MPCRSGLHRKHAKEGYKTHNQFVNNTSKVFEENYRKKIIQFSTKLFKLMIKKRKNNIKNISSTGLPLPRQTPYSRPRRRKHHRINKHKGSNSGNPTKPSTNSSLARNPRRNTKQNKRLSRKDKKQPPSSHFVLTSGRRDAPPTQTEFNSTGCPRLLQQRHSWLESLSCHEVLPAWKQSEHERTIH